MTCRKHQAQLSAYLDDRLDARPRAEFEANLAGCPACQQTLQLLRGAGRILASEPPATPPPGLAARVTRAALAAERAPATRLLDGWFTVAWPTAAVTALATVLLLLLSTPQPAAAQTTDASDPLGILVVGDNTPADPLAGEVLALEVQE